MNKSCQWVGLQVHLIWKRILTFDLHILYLLTSFVGQGVDHTGGGASGATHAGRGGHGCKVNPFTIQPVMSVGDIFQPSTWGSGGGSYSSTHLGGRGGGKIYLNTKLFHVDGVVRMNALNAPGVSRLWNAFFFVKIVFLTNLH